MTRCKCTSSTTMSHNASNRFDLVHIPKPNSVTLSWKMALYQHWYASESSVRHQLYWNVHHTWQVMTAIYNWPLISHWYRHDLTLWCMRGGIFPVFVDFIQLIKYSVNPYDILSSKCQKWRRCKWEDINVWNRHRSVGRSAQFHGVARFLPI